MFVRIMFEFQSWSLILSQRVAKLLQKELADGDKTKLASELATLQKSYKKEKSVWAEERRALEENAKQSKTWKVMSLDSEKEAKTKEKDFKSEIKYPLTVPILISSCGQCNVNYIVEYILSTYT